MSLLTLPIPLTNDGLSLLTLSTPLTNNGLSLLTLPIPLTNNGLSLLTLPIPLTNNGLSLLTLPIPLTNHGLSLLTLPIPLTNHGLSLLTLPIPLTNNGLSLLTLPIPLTNHGLSLLTLPIPLTNDGLFLLTLPTPLTNHGLSLLTLPTPLTNHGLSLLTLSTPSLGVRCLFPGPVLQRWPAVSPNRWCHFFLNKLPSNLIDTFKLCARQRRVFTLQCPQRFVWTYKSSKESRCYMWIVSGYENTHTWSSHYLSTRYLVPRVEWVKHKLHYAQRACVSQKSKDFVREWSVQLWLSCQSVTLQERYSNWDLSVQLYNQQ